MNISVLEKNVLNAFGATGSKWISALPVIIEKLSDYWSLTNIDPAKNMNWNYVAYAIQNNQDQAVLKISCDQAMINNEYHALKHFNGHGAIKVIDRHEEYQAILLQQAIPGDSLKKNHPVEAEKIIALYTKVVNAIASQKLSNSTYVHMNTWCDSVDHIQDKRIDKRFVDKAKQLKLYLLTSVRDEYLCHGDLHLENIIQNGNDWLVIDPKGIIGEMAFEAAAFDLLSDNEMNDASTIESKLINRVNQLSTHLDIDFESMKNILCKRPSH
jgi:streptomycin 6-kinase